MIELTELATTLQDILNNANNPINNYNFNVQTYGYHLDSIVNKKLNQNSIPVYIANQEGDIVPIPNLGQTNYTYDIFIYFPIALKTDFFKLSSYLSTTFVGKILNYGTNSGSGVSNISVPTFGELQNQQMTEFKTWVNTNFNLSVVATEKWACLNFKLYITQLNSGFLFGNQVLSTLSFTYNGTTYSENLVYFSQARNMTADVSSQQALTDYETKALTKNTSYGDSIEVYIQDNDFWHKFIELYESGLLQNRAFTFTRSYAFASGSVSYSKNIILSTSINSYELGTPQTITITMVKKASI